jgi:hypothetical protein
MRKDLKIVKYQLEAEEGIVRFMERLQTMADEIRVRRDFERSEEEGSDDVEAEDEGPLERIDSGAEGSAGMHE